MKQTVLLVTTVDYSAAARLAGALSVLGARVAAVYPSGHPLGASRFVDAAYGYWALAPLDSVTTAIRAAAPDRVVPCDDRALALLLQVGGEDALLARSLGPPQSYSVLMARAAAMTAASGEGIAAPLTLAVASLADLPQALKRIGLPCVMKTDSSWGGQGVRYISSGAEAERWFARLQGPPSRLRSLLRAAKRRDLHFLAAAQHPAQAAVSLQTLVPGTPATTVFAAENGKVKAVQHMDVLSWRGTAGPASLMRRVADAVMDAAAVKIAARFHLNGLHGLDFMRDAAGMPHLIEVNPRATQICHLPLDGDVAAAFLSVPARPAATRLQDVALFPQLLAMGELPASVFADIPRDDPGLLRQVQGDVLADATVLTVGGLAQTGVAPAWHGRR